MDMLYWLLIAAVFIIAFIGLVYPVIPSVVFIVAGFVLYGFLFSFSPYSYMFWLVEAVFLCSIIRGRLRVESAWSKKVRRKQRRHMGKHDRFINRAFCHSGCRDHIGAVYRGCLRRTYRPSEGLKVSV